MSHTIWCKIFGIEKFTARQSLYFTVWIFCDDVISGRTRSISLKSYARAIFLFLRTYVSILYFSDRSFGLIYSLASLFKVNRVPLNVYAKRDINHLFYFKRKRFFSCFFFYFNIVFFHLAFPPEASLFNLNWFTDSIFCVLRLYSVATVANIDLLRSFGLNLFNRRMPKAPPAGWTLRRKVRRAATFTCEIWLRVSDEHRLNVLTLILPVFNLPLHVLALSWRTSAKLIYHAFIRSARCRPERLKFHF
jgi:hypothetical protein